MAEIHKNVPLAAGVWTDLTAAFAIAVDTKWGFEAVGAAVELVETDSSDAPAEATRGQRIFPGTSTRQGDQLEWTRASGRTLWARAGGPAVVVAAPVS